MGKKKEGTGGLSTIALAKVVSDGELCPFYVA